MPAAKQAQQVQLRPTAEAVLARFAEMVTIIPEADDSDAAMNMIDQILNVDDIKAANDIWTSEEKAKDQMIGDTLVIYRAERRASDFGEGLPFYLDCDVINSSRQNAQLRWTCSAASAVAQIVKAYATNQMPIRVRVEAAKTRSGYTAMHLFVVDTNVDLAQFGL